MPILSPAAPAPEQALAGTASWSVRLVDRAQAPPRLFALIAQHDLPIEGLSFDGAVLAITAAGSSELLADRIAAKMRRVIGVRDVVLTWRRDAF